MFGRKNKKPLEKEYVYMNYNGVSDSKLRERIVFELLRRYSSTIPLPKSIEDMSEDIFNYIKNGKAG